MFRSLLQIFICTHKKYSWPITRHKVTYCVCLECGREMKYDFNAMKFIEFDKGERRKIMEVNYVRTN